MQEEQNTNKENTNYCQAGETFECSDCHPEKGYADYHKDIQCNCICHIPKNATVIRVCPITDGTCDRTCGYPAHGLLTRKFQIAHHHTKIVCDICSRLIAQCKCISEETVIELQTCPECSTSTIQNNKVEEVIKDWNNQADKLINDL